MWTALLAFLKPHWLKIATYAGIALAVLAVLLGARSAGRNAEKVDSLKKEIKARDRANEIRNDVAADHAAGVVPKRVRKFYVD